MDVTKTRFEDAGEQDEDGYYNYYYAGHIYCCVSEKEAFIIRRYDMSDEASFMSREVKAKCKWKSERFESIPYESALFQEAIQYLIEVEQVRRITVFLGEYMPVSLHRLKLGTRLSII